VFTNLPADALLRLERGATEFELRSGTELFAQGDPADAVYAIVGGEGRVQTGVSHRHSKRLMIEVFSIGDIFGEMGVIDPGPRSASAVTDGRVRMMRIGAATFIAVLNDTPQLGTNLSRLLAHRLRRTFVLFQDATFERLEVLLARQVLYLAEQHGRRTERGVLLGERLRQHDLADLLGAATRSIITILNSWRAERIVHYDTQKAQLTVLQPERLHKLIKDQD
jgi:CRP/FNR family transcriptional regulator, cyclic AMP receptor protein